MHPVMKDEETRNWAELPPELTSSILSRLGPVEILEDAQKVCKSWRRVCKDPSMWRKIDLTNPETMVYDMKTLCRHAIDLSKGGLVEINLGNFGSNSLLTYIANRSRYLRCLRVVMRYILTSEGLVNAVMKLPFLEVVDISYYDEQLNLKAIGHSCPSLKTLKVNRMCLSDWDFVCNDDDALAIAETMPELRHLELFGHGLTNTGLKAILDNCPHLEHLDLRQCFNLNFFGDLEKQCSERIKNLRRPNDSTGDHPFKAILCGTDEETESEEEDEIVFAASEEDEEDEDNSYGNDIEYVYDYDMSGDDVNDQSDMDDSYYD